MRSPGLGAYWALLSLIAGSLLVSDVFHIKLKAWVAQQLLERAWTETRVGGASVPPWPWADTSPVARLTVPRLGVDQIVLAGASGRNLAFGPTHVTASAEPGAGGHVVISGHRDTHFAFLAKLRQGDTLVVEDRSGHRNRYRVEVMEIINIKEQGFHLVTGFDGLSLVTCYPFLSPAPGTPMRLIATATAVPEVGT